MAVFDCVTLLVLLRDTHAQAVLFVHVFAQARQPDVDVSCSLNHDGKGTEAYRVVTLLIILLWDGALRQGIISTDCSPLKSAK